MSSWWMVVPITMMLAPVFNMLYQMWHSRRATVLQAVHNPYATSESKPCPKCGVVGHSCPNFVPPPPVWDHENEGPLYPPW